MLRICTNLTTLVLHELVSSSTLLLIAFHTKSRLRQLHVRRNAILLRFDWKNEETHDWSPEFHAWLKWASRDYGVFEEEMSSLLNRKWRALSDLEFKSLSNVILEN